MLRQFLPLAREMSEWVLPEPIPRRTLKPGETFRGTIVLNDWYFQVIKRNQPGRITEVHFERLAFKQPGSYIVRAEYFDYTAVRLPGGKGPYPALPGVTGGGGAVVRPLELLAFNLDKDAMFADLAGQKRLDTPAAYDKIRLDSPPLTIRIAAASPAGPTRSPCPGESRTPLG